MAHKPQLAFIRRYTCMYTRDLTKKAKSWHDGYLVFHHLNAKMVLLSDNFTILDECFFRAPGLDIMRDIPKTYNVPADTQVSFDKYLATLDEAVFQEEKDISEIYEKKRKQAADLDDFVDSEDDAPAAPSAKRHQRLDSPAQRQPSLPSVPRTGWLYRISDQTAGRASSQTFASSASPSVRSLARMQQPGGHSTPLRGQLCGNLQRTALNATPRTTTPFKPPSFVTAGPASSPVPARPISAPRRTLGSTRPSSSLARQSLQAEWSKYADQVPKSTSKGRSSSDRATSYKESPAKRDERRAAHLERIKNQPEPEIVPVNQKRRDGEPGDPSSWLFES